MPVILPTRHLQERPCRGGVRLPVRGPEADSAKGEDVVSCPDRVADVRGLAVKVLGVAGPKVIPGLEAAATPAFRARLQERGARRFDLRFSEKGMQDSRPLSLLGLQTLAALSEQCVPLPVPA